MTLLLASEHNEQLQALVGLLQPHLDTPVWTAENIGQLEDLANEFEELDALLCDYAFSEADGLVVAQALRAKFPALQVAYIAETMDVETGGDTVFGPETTPEHLEQWVQGLRQSIDGVAPVPVAGVEAVPALPAAAHDPSTTPAEPVDPLRRPTSLLGLILGDYEIREKRRSFETTESYLAWQISMNRPVVLERLKAQHLDDAEAKRYFRAMVRARASIGHPSIASVYEAQETRTGEIFYTRECVQGQTLEELRATNQKVSQVSLLSLLQAIATCMGHYADKSVTREPAQPYHFRIAADGLPRLGNIAMPNAPQVDEAEEMTKVAGWIQAVAEQPMPQELGAVLRRMQPTAPNRLHNWRELIRLAEGGLAAAKSRAGTSAATGNLRRNANTRTKWVWGGTAAAALLAVVGITALNREQEQETMPVSRIPGTTKVPAFEMDRYEVTVGQYEEFLKATESQGTTDAAQASKLNHSQQPATKTSHKPKNWEALLAAAKENGSFQNVPVSLKSPVVWVDWWDAYAYAQWKGRRLPSLEEWTLAASGHPPQPYAWGTEPNPTNANSGDDHSQDPSNPGGQADGHNYWCPVDGMPKDRSIYGVIGLAGNVSEWVATWGQHPSVPEQQSPMYCGGSFFRKSAPLEKQQSSAGSPQSAEPHIGFRTVIATPAP